jgi:uncharacterized protein (TIGR03083 family)
VGHRRDPEEGVRHILIGMLDRIEAIIADSARIAQLAALVDPAAPVPSCPEWTFRDLVTHVGEVQQFWAHNVAAADVEGPWNGEKHWPGPDDLAEWMGRSSAQLIAALRAADESAPCWTWWGEPRTAGAVARHQVQEAAVHRWDAESVAGHPTALAPDVAHDGVGEFIEVMIGTDADDLAGVVVLRSTDTDAGDEWRIGGAAPGSGSGSAAALVTGSASDLVLFLYRRVGVDTASISVSGDEDLVQSLLALIDAS